tara:strand:- start:83 stop:1003 length:921 start_codon:yes stop_codon:yes gene_type:complete
MYDLLFKSILQETGYNIQNDEKYINLYRYHYASVFHRIDTDDIIDLNREVLNSIGSLILKDIRQNSIQKPLQTELQPVSKSVSKSESTTPNQSSTTIVQDTPSKNIVLYSVQRLSNSLNRYNFAINVSFTEFMPTTLTLVKNSNSNNSGNSLFSNPNLNVLFNDTENIVFSVKDTNSFNDKEYITYESVLPDKIKCEKTLKVQIRNYLMNNPLETSDIYEIVKRKKIKYENEDYLCLELKDTSEFESGSEIGLFSIESDNSEINIKTSLFVKKVVGKYLLFEDKKLSRTLNALTSLDHNVTLNGKI